MRKLARMKRAVVLKHAEFEGPSRLAELVAGEGYQVDVRSLHRGDDVPSDLGRHEMLIVMGGPMGVGDLERAEYPYLRREVELLRQRVVEDAPVLGMSRSAALGTCSRCRRAFDDDDRRAPSAV